MANSSSLSIGKLAPVLLTHVEFEKRYCIAYGQFCDSEVVESLSEQVLESATSASSIQSCFIGDIVLALYREDENWYRGKILSVNDNDTVSVHFIDYGNSEEVHVSDVREVIGDIKQIPSLAIKFVLDDINPSAGGIWSNSDKEKLKDDLINKEFTAEVTDIANDMMVVALHTDNGLYQFGIKDGSNSSSLLSMKLNVGESYKSYISYVDNANKFWIQLKQYEVNLENLMQDIANFVESEAKPLPQAKRGTCCMAKFSDDMVPYRSKVLGITGDKCLVQFVDYGNSESKSLSDLMEIPEQFCLLPIQGYKCCYKTSKLNSNTLDEKVQELTLEENGVLVKVVSKSADEYTVEIDKIEKLLVTDSIELEAYKPLPIDLKKEFDICISHVYHPGRFYVQMIENATLIDSLMAKIEEEFNSSQNNINLNTGMACIAKLSDDAVYRSVVKSIKTSSAFVIAIDFGFEEWVSCSQVQEVSSRSMQLPAQAIECTVDSTKTEEKYWSSKEIKILTELESEPLVAKVTAKRGSVYQLDLHDTKDPDLDRYVNAELLGVGKDMNVNNQVSNSNRATKLQKVPISIPAPEITVGRKELLCVTSVKSANQFFAQLTHRISEVGELQKQLHATYEKYSTAQGSIKSIGIGDVCTTKYIDGGWYRGLVTSIDNEKIEISFVDFGDSTVCNLTNLKELQEIFTVLPQQCIICNIANLNSGVNKDTLDRIMTNQVIEVQIKEKKEFPFPSYEVDLSNHPNNNKILQMLKGHPAVPRIPRGPTISNSNFAEALNDYQTTVVSLYTAEEVMITHVVDPEHFHCQLKKYATHLDDIMQLLDDHCKKLGPNDDRLENIHLGQPCLAKFSADDSWYRAKVTGILAGDNLVEVLFIDYGNTECQERNGLKIIQPQHMSLPAQAIYCGLSGVAASQGFWPPEHIAQFEDLTLDQNFNTFFKKWNKEENRYSVEMTTLTGESFNLKFGSLSNSLVTEQSYDSGQKATSDGGRQTSGSPGGGFGAASRSFGRGDDDKKDRFGNGGPFRSKDSHRGSHSSGFGGDQAARSGGFGANRDGRNNLGLEKGKGFSNSIDSDRGVQHRFREDKDGGKGRFVGGNRSGFTGLTNADTNSDNDWGDGPSATFGAKSSGERSGGFGENKRAGGFGKQDSSDHTSGRGGGFRDLVQDDNKSDHRSGFKQRQGGFGSDRNSRQGNFNSDRGSRSNGFNVDDNSSDGGFGSGRGGRGGGGFGRNTGGRGGYSGGFGQDKDKQTDQGSSFRGRHGDRGGGRGGHNSGFRKDQNDDISGGFGGHGDRGGGRGGRNSGFRKDQNDDISGGFGGHGDRGGGRGGRNSGFRKDQNDGISGGFGGGRDRHGGFGGHRGGNVGGFGKIQAEDGQKGSGFGSNTAQTSDETWGDESDNISQVQQPSRFGKSAGDGDSWNVKPANSSSMMHISSGAGDNKWEHKNLDRFVAQKIVLEKDIKAVVVYSNSPGEFWCQNLEHVPSLETMSEKMNNEYNSLVDESNLEKVEMKVPCIARSCEDQMWYRAEITNTYGNDVEVYFVDYGNTEKVSKSSVKAIKSEYFCLPIQGIKCTLNNVSPVGNVWSEQSNTDFINLTSDKNCQVKLIKYSNLAYIVELKDLDTNVDIATKLVELGHAKQKMENQSILNPYVCTTLPQDIPREAYVSWIENPHCFWIQPSDTSDKLENLVDKIQNEYTSGVSASSSVQKTDVGSPVIAQFSEDNAWYRAYIEQVNGEMYSVRFVDYGNSDIVELGKLRKPTEELLNTPVHAIKCRLAGVKPLQTGTWNVDAKDIMEGLVSDNVVTCRTKFVDQNEHTVELTVGSINIAEELKQAAVARTDENEVETLQTEPVEASQVFRNQQTTLLIKKVPLGTSVVGYVSAIKSPSKFFIQLASEESDLEKLASRLQSSYDENPGESTKMVKKGEHYCTRYTEDGAWYRALVEEIGDKITVFFVDYGNSEEVSLEALKLMKTEFVDLPPFAIKCCLSGAQPVLKEWSDEAVAAFEEATMDQELSLLFVTDTRVSVTNTQGDVAEFLINEGHAKNESCVSDMTLLTSIENQIKPNGEVSVYISSVEENGFYLQLTSQDVALQEMAEQLQALCPTLQSVEEGSLCVGSYCCGKFSEDSQWYRALITEINQKQATVTFVDYGNCETLNIDSLKYLHKDILTPAMAYHCSLDGYENVDTAIIEQRLTALTESTDLKAVFTGIADKTYKVLLIEDGKNINEELADKVVTAEALTEGEMDGLDEMSEEQKLADTKVVIAEALTEGEMEGLDEMSEEQKLADTKDAQEPIVIDINQIKQETLKEGDRIMVTVSHIESPSKFYIHKEGNASDLDTLLDDMFNFYSELPDKQYNMSEVQKGMICASKFTEDDAWYRGQVLSVEGEKALVFFVDHGNAEDVEIKSIKQLLTRFSELPIQGIPCMLSGIGAPNEKWNNEDIVLFTELTENKTLLADIVGYAKGKTYIIQLLDMGISISKSMIDKAHGVVVTTPRVNTKIRRVFSDSSDVASPLRMPSLTADETIEEDPLFGYSRFPIKVGQVYKVKVTQVENPTCFWCQIVDPENKFQTLTDSLQGKYKDSTDTVDKINSPCVARCKGDDQYYRGLIKSCSEDGEITVLFVDFGGLYCVQKEDIKSIKPEDLELPAQAVDCMLHDIDLDEFQDDWDEETCEYFENLVEGKTLTMVVQQACNEGVSVYLFDGNADISLELAQNGFVNLSSQVKNDCSPLKRKQKVIVESLGRLLSSDSEHQVLISHVVSPSCFYVVFKENSLENIKEKIKNHLEVNSNDILEEEDIQPGITCLACSKDDWQRAKIEDVQENSVLVFLIDIGNKEFVKKTELRKTSDNIANLPPQAFLCELADIKPLEGMNEWPEDTVVYFQDVCPPGGERWIYILDSNEDKLKVNLFDGKLKTTKELDQQIAVQLVKLGFADCIPGSVLEEIIEEEENYEPMFSEMSLNRENSYGSTEGQDTSGLDDSSICQCETTTDQSTYPEDSELDTTASESFAYIDFKPVPKITEDDLDGIPVNDTEEGEGFCNVDKKNESNETIQECEHSEQVVCEKAIESLGETDNKNEMVKNIDEEAETEGDDKVNNEAESDEEEDTVKCNSEDEDQKLEIDHLKSIIVEEETLDDDISIEDAKGRVEGGDKSRCNQEVDTGKTEKYKEAMEEFIEHSVEELAIEKYNEEHMESACMSDAENNNKDAADTEIEVVEDQLEALNDLAAVADTTRNVEKDDQNGVGNLDNVDGSGEVDRHEENDTAQVTNDGGYESLAHGIGNEKSGLVDDKENNNVGESVDQNCPLGDEVEINVKGGESVDHDTDDQKCGLEDEINKNFIRDHDCGLGDETDQIDIGDQKCQLDDEMDKNDSGNEKSGLENEIDKSDVGHEKSELENEIDKSDVGHEKSELEDEIDKREVGHEKSGLENEIDKSYVGHEKSELEDEIDKRDVGHEKSGLENEIDKNDIGDQKSGLENELTGKEAYNDMGLKDMDMIEGNLCMKESENTEICDAEKEEQSS